MPPLDSTTFDPFAAAGFAPVTPEVAQVAPATVAPTASASAPAPGQAVALGVGGAVPVALPAALPPVNLPQIAAAPLPALPTAPPGTEISIGGARPEYPALDTTLAQLRAAQGVQASVVVTPQPAAGVAPVSGALTGAGLLGAPPGAAAAPLVPQEPFAAAGFAEAAPAPAAPSAQAQEARAQPWYGPIADTVRSIGQTVGGLSDEAAHGFTFGLDEIVAPVPAAAALSLGTGMPFSQAYDQVVQQHRQERHAVEQQTPIAATAAGLAGGMASPLNFPGLFGVASAGSSYVARAANAVRNVAASAGLGGAAGAGMTEGDLAQRARGAVQGAELGGAIGAAVPAAGAAARAIGAIPAAARPFVNPQGAAEQQVGRLLTEQAPGAVPAMAPSPIAGMPLNVAQASGRPELASLVDTRNAANVGAMQRERSLQNQALLDTLPGRAAGSVPEETAARASGAVAENVRQAQTLISREESRLWNKPSLADPRVTTATTKREVAAVVGRTRQDQPGLALALDESGILRRTVAELEGMPERAAANQINAISSRFRAIARDPSQADDVRYIARKLAQATQDGIWKAPEIVGAPARTVPRGWEQRNGQTVWTDGYTVPAVRPDPELKTDLEAARAFTRREAAVLGHASFDAILRRNSRGNVAAAPETALNRFFDFANGVERPGSIKNVTDFLNDIKAEWSSLRAQGAATTYDPAAIDPVRRELIDNSRDFIIAKMLGRVSGSAADMGGERMIRTAQIRKWLDVNGRMVRESGMFTPEQIDALNRVRNAADLIERGYERGRPINSATYSRLSGDRFIDAFLHPVIGAAAGAAIGAATLGTIGRIVGEGGLGVVLGAEVGGGAGLGASLVRRLYEMPRQRALALLDEAIRNPDLARNLMMKATADNARKMSPDTVKWLRAIAASQPAAQAMRVYGPGSPAGASP